MLCLSSYFWSDATAITIGKHPGKDRPENKKLGQEIYRDQQECNRSRRLKKRADFRAGQVPSQPFGASGQQECGHTRTDRSIFPTDLCVGQQFKQQGYRYHADSYIRPMVEKRAGQLKLE